MDQLFDSRVTVGLGAGQVLVGRIPRQQPRQSSSVPGGTAESAIERNHDRDRPSLSPAGDPQAIAWPRLHVRWADASIATQQSRVSPHISWKVSRPLADN